MEGENARGGCACGGGPHSSGSGSIHAGINTWREFWRAVGFGRGRTTYGGMDVQEDGGAMRQSTISFWMTLRRWSSVASKTGHPCFLLAHSFGGQITLRYLQERMPNVCGAVICSPWLKLAFAPKWWRIALARLALWVCPSLPHKTPATPTLLSRDREYLLSLPDPDLMHRFLSPRLYFAIEAAGRKALVDARLLQVPLLFIHGGDDRVTCMLATRELYEGAASKDKTFSVYPDARHETHNDLCRDRVISEICQWIGARTGGA